MTRTLALAALALAASGAAAGRVTAPEVESDRTVTGTLTEARVHFLSAATGHRPEFAAHMGLRANLPAVLVTAGGDVYYLAARPDTLAPLSGKGVKVVGKLQSAAGVLKPDRVWVRAGETWEEVKPQRPEGRP
jgi:hypothetical protein